MAAPSEPLQERLQDKAASRDKSPRATATETGATRYQIIANDQPAGVLVMRNPWLHGPYLHLLGLLPAYHRRGIGDIALRWIEAEAQGHFRNLWLCVSAFNT